MPHIWRRYVTHRNEACHTYEWVVSLGVRESSVCAGRRCGCGVMGQLSAGNRSRRVTAPLCHAVMVGARTGTAYFFGGATAGMYEWVMLLLYLSHVTCMNESCHTHERVMGWSRAFAWWCCCRYTWMGHVTHMHESYHIYEVQIWMNMSHIQMGHELDKLVCLMVLLRIGPRNVTHSCMWHDSHICASWLNYMCEHTHTYIR